MWTQEYRQKYDKEYRQRKLLDPTYKDRLNSQKLSYVNKLRYGGLRKLILERDEYTCVNCGMTSQEHKEKWNRELTINHKDGQGRYSLSPNNKPSNLETLCLRCHGRKDSTRGWQERSVDRKVTKIK